ncbi:MAG: hypothetical protein JST16_11390 [Bdellovibrionales bacterium]|nr:hypothetical protein [Bdellovibrionales bacterium]
MGGNRVHSLCRSVTFLALFAFAAQAAPLQDFAAKSYVTKPSKLWTEPSQYGEAIAVLEPGLRFDVISYSTEKDWAEIRTPAGREGWIPVRFTALAGRRSDDVLIGENAAANVREPASQEAPKVLDKVPVDEEDAVPDISGRQVTPVAAKGIVKVKPVEKTADPKAKASEGLAPREWSFALEYTQQLTPEQMPGFSLRPDAFWAHNSQWAFGGGLDYVYATKTLTDTANDVRAKTTKNIHRIFPHGSVRFASRALRVDGALGIIFQRTSFDTRDLDTNAQIATNPAGQTVSGAEWDTSLGVRISPAYLFPVGGGMNLGPVLSYSLRVGLSSGSGTFPVESDSRFQHAFGGGALLTSAW